MCINSLDSIAIEICDDVLSLCVLIKSSKDVFGECFDREWYATGKVSLFSL